MEGLIEGRIVHYTPGVSDTFKEHRPAMLVRVWDQVSGCANLQVFTDGSNDGHPSGMMWATSVVYSETPAPRTWHWIERA